MHHVPQRAVVHPRPVAYEVTVRVDGKNGHDDEVDRVRWNEGSASGRLGGLQPPRLQVGLRGCPELDALGVVVHAGIRHGDTPSPCLLSQACGRYSPLGGRHRTQTQNPGTIPHGKLHHA